MQSARYPDPPLDDGLILLRPWRSTDVVKVAEAIRDPAIQRWSHLSYGDIETLRRRVAEMPTEMAAGAAIRMLIVDARDDEALFGAIALFDINLKAHTAEVGYWLAASARGRGIASRALGLISNWAAQELALRRFLAKCDVGNEGSQRLLRRVGFTARGRAPNTSPPALLYALEIR